MRLGERSQALPGEPWREVERRLWWRALSELERVHALELGELFAAAAWIAARWREPSAGLAVSPFAAAPFAVADGVRGTQRPFELSAWRRAVARELTVAHATPHLRAAMRSLARLAALPPQRWPAESTLAALALRLAPTPLARLTDALARASGGDPDGAAACLAELVAGRLPGPLQGSAQFGLGLCHLARRRTALALGAFEAAAEAPGSGLDALVSSLALAHALGDRRRARRAAARLDLLVAGADPELDPALARLGDQLARLELRRPAARIAQPGRSDASPAERVLALLV